MGKFQWHEKGSKVADAVPRIVIGDNYIRFSKGLLRKYGFGGGECYVMLAYDRESQVLAIKPTHSTDRKRGMKFHATHRIVTCSGFIGANRLFHPSLKKSLPYEDVSWDKAEDCLVVRGVRQFVEEKPVKEVAK